ncbi:bifunctional (p)ppGpp synthetase/guanosine-3',5'-bis(diphosphate) 3'-pyrophosphohydrolase [Odoribacter sp. Z80]|uniref:RelA/SpoT family protein n=1 Tax=Odoribacter sp. Z80 TaxID=2304575 RepID=UPI00137B4F7A|nr:RelA/SpoT family protein [Odoribacter sp. Z80]NCE71372.1 bifunctional (p)ppGpp synthetase/guanosine-3',5'-bis(diphosphate) 3'-pyrophosphohydrolase [Odoribacter sp. Z80]
MKALEKSQYRPLILSKYTSVLKSCRNLISSEDIRQIRQAFKIAIQNETISEQLDYGEILKILDITLIITQEIGLGRTSIICAMLHKTVEKEMLSLQQVREMFGDKVWQIIKGLKDISHIYATQRIVNSENFRKLLLSFAEDIRVQLIFLAEKLHALRQADALSADEQKQLAMETSYIYIPFAHRLGLYNIKSEMEDTALRYSNPHIYKEIEQKLKDSKNAREAYIAEFIAPITTELDRRGIKYKMKYRTKTIASILNKMRKSQVEFEEIYDIFAVRFIIDSTGENEKPDCWRVYSIVTDKYTPNPQRLRDWISVPKSNGYESLQTTVLGPRNRWVEVQIRTERMDEIAEKGFAAHWKYKGGTSDSVIENWLNELREILESNKDNAIDLLDDMKINLQDKEVHVFTPKGDLITLQAGATLLDFAYAIHTNIGGKCVGGIVNDRNETLKYVLKNGDQISIITAANQQPKADWLNFTVTSKARNKIRQFLNEEINHQADIGKEMLMRRFKNWKIEFTDEIIRKLMHHYKYKFALDLYHGVAIGKHEPSEIKEILIQPEEKPSSITIPKDIKVERPRKIDEDVLLIDKNVDNVDYKFARCCNPVYGDDIIGFVSIGEGIKVHRRQCKNAQELMRRYPYRIVKTQWTNDGATSYQTILNLTGKGEGNIINKITELIAKDPHATLRAISINSSEGLFDGNITVLIDNTEHLDQLISRLKHLSGILKVNRHDSMLE